MFYRRCKNRSGSTSIQIVQKTGNKYKVLKTIGSSSDPDELSRFEHLARTEINKLQGQKSLFSSQADHQLQNIIAGIGNHQIEVVGPELILGNIYDKIGYSQLQEDEYFRHLVLARIVQPGSKLKTTDYLLRYQNIEVGVDTIYRYMDKLHSQYKDTIEQITFDHSQKQIGSQLSIVFYDMTTLYFETPDEDDLRQIGYSKDGKHQHPQIKLGLLVGKNGFPIGYDIFEGSKYEGHTLIPVLEQIQKKFGVGRPTVVADAGLLSNQNIRALEDNGYQFILGGRIKNEKQSIKEQLQQQQITESNSVEIPKDGHRLIVSYSAKRAKKDAHNRERGLKRLEDKVQKGKLTKSSINNRGYNKYLHLEGDVKVKIDYDKFEADKKWDGLKGYLTNTKELTRTEVIDAYNNLWHVEKAFRISKTDIRARPIFHRLKRRIEAHICICFAAYAVYKELERLLIEKKAFISIARAIELMKSMYQIAVQLPDSKEIVKIPLKRDEQQEELVQLIS